MHTVVVGHRYQVRGLGQFGDSPSINALMVISEQCHRPSLLMPLTSSSTLCVTRAVFHLAAFPRQITGQDYDAFVAEFIEAAVDKYGKSVMLQVL